MGEARTIELATADGPMAIYEAPMTGDARGAVIVIQEAFGVNAHIEDVTRRFEAAGYHAVAPALFHRAGGGTAPYDDFSKVMPLYEGLTDDGILVDLDATLGHLRGEGFTDDRIGIVGFCFGGRVTFLAGLHHALGAAAGFYGGGIVNQRFPQFPPLVADAGRLQTPWLGLFGDQDGSIPVEEVEQLRTALEQAPVDTEIIRYEDAEHGFHCDVRESYHEAAAQDAWQRTLDWFGSHLGAAR